MVLGETWCARVCTVWSLFGKRWNTHGCWIWPNMQVKVSRTRALQVADPGMRWLAIFIAGDDRQGNGAHG